MSDEVRHTFDILFGKTFTVDLQREGQAVPVECRPLPFTTLMVLLGEVSATAHAQIAQARKQIMEKFIERGVLIQSPKEGEDGIDTAEILEIILPIIYAAAQDAPNLVEQFMMDVVVGIKAEHARLFTPEDVLSITEGVLKRIDTKRLAEKARLVFSQATEIMTATVEGQVNVERKRKVTTRPKATKSPSQSKQAI